MTDAPLVLPAEEVAALEAVHRKLLWLAAWMVHNANHLRSKTEGDVKVGGHQASSASMAAIMTALYFHVLRPEDRVAVKPHAAPVFHAMNYLMGRQSRARLEGFRAWGGAQSYPSRTKDGPEVDFSTGSVGLGAAMPIFASLVQDYLKAHGWGPDRPGRMVALIGDAELDEGNVYEALLESWKHDVRNVWWVIDYNRQSLDGVVREGLWERIESVFAAFGWRLVRLKHGALQRAAFAEPGGEALRDWIDRCPNQLYSALTFQGGVAWRQRLMDDLGDQGAVAALLSRRSDAGLRRFLDRVPFFQGGPRRLSAPAVAVPPPVTPVERRISTQAAFGHILDDIARQGGPLADRILTMSPDVTVSTNLGAWVNRRGLFAREVVDDTFRTARIPSSQKWAFSPTGQHLELGIAEMNLMLALGAAGLSHSLWGERLIPVGTVYDPFVVRGLDALNYACYQDARFLLVGTPSGVALAPEGGAHQSVGTPLIGMAQDGLASFEPAFADELAQIMNWAWHYLQRNGEGDPDERTWLRDETGGSVYLRLSTRPMEQVLRRTDPDFASGVIDGAYWVRPPGPNCEVVIAYQGAVAPEAITATGALSGARRDMGLLAVTSADRLNAGWTAARRARARGHASATGLAERLLAPLPRDCALVTVIDGHPATLAWLGGVIGHRTLPLGVEHFGQTGTIADLYRHYGIDADGILDAVERLTPGARPHRLRPAG